MPETKYCNRHQVHHNGSECSLCLYAFPEIKEEVPTAGRSIYVFPEIKEEAPTASRTRKDSPVFSGVMQYFPDALLAISAHSKRGNDKHNPGQPMHWAREKSSDQADCVARHLIDIGPNWDALDPETGSYHATALAWRALALLQLVLEKEKK